MATLIRYPGFTRRMRESWGSGEPFLRPFLTCAKGMPFAARSLQTVIDFETAGTWSTAVRNPVSPAVGYLQWMPDTASSLGTSSAAIAAMSPHEQFELVRRTFAVNASHLRATQKDGVALVGDVYLAVWGPGYIGAPSSREIARAGSKVFDQNPFKVATPGVLTVGDVRGAIERYHNAGISTYGDLAVGASGGAARKGSGGGGALAAFAALGAGAMLWRSR